MFTEPHWHSYTMASSTLNLLNKGYLGELTCPLLRGVPLSNVGWDKDSFFQRVFFKRKFCCITQGFNPNLTHCLSSAAAIKVFCCAFSESFRLMDWSRVAQWIMSLSLRRLEGLRPSKPHESDEKTGSSSSLLSSTSSRSSRHTSVSGTVYTVDHLSMHSLICKLQLVPAAPTACLRCRFPAQPAHTYKQVRVN